MRPRDGMSFETEGEIIRSVAPLAPPQLRNDFHTVMQALEQVQDGENGAISVDQMTLIGTQHLSQAMAAIDAYTNGWCGVHVARVLPTFPGP